LFFDTSIKTFSFLYSRNPEERKNYKTCQDFRIQREDGTWIRLIQQMLVIELDNSGNIWLVLLVNDISPVRDQAIPGRRYMEHVTTKKRVLFPDSDASARCSTAADAVLYYLSLDDNDWQEVADMFRQMKDKGFDLLASREL
jgi:hypothetical protein